MQILKKTAILFILILSQLTPALYADTESSSPSEEYLLTGDYENFFLHNLQLAQTDPENAYIPLLLAHNVHKQFLSNAGLGKNQIQDLLDNEGLSPLSRNLCRQMLAGIYDSEGEEFKATAIRRADGIIPVWRIAGAFGEYEQASFYQTFAPEGNIDFSIFMPGLARDVTWRLLSENVCLNNFIPYRWISPARGVLYLYTQFKLPEETDIILEKTGPAAFSFWLDGIECGTSDPMQQLTGATTRFKSPYTLAAGWHRLLIKLYSPDKESPELFRLLNPEFKPLKGIIFNAKNPAGNNNSGSREWQKLPQDTTDYTNTEKALYYQYNQEYDQALSYWRKAIQEEPDNSALHIYYASCAGQALDILPGPMRSSIIRQEALKALKLDPEAVGALLILGDHETQNKRFTRAESYYTQALKINPKAIIAHSSRIRIALENSWYAESTEWLQNLEEIYPEGYLSLLLKSMYYNRFGHIRKAAQTLEKAYRLDKSSITVAIDCIKSYFASGDSEKALQIINDLPSYYRQRVDILLLQGEILSRTGNTDQAVTTLKQSLQAVGNDPGILKKQGDILFTARDYASALAQYKLSLELDSGNYTLRRLITELEDGDYRFWKNFALNTNKIIDDFIQTHGKYFGSTARLIDQTVITIQDSGGYSNYTHELQAVLTDSGINKAAVIDTYGELLQARTIIPEKGRSLEPVILKGSPEIIMPAVAPGAITEHTYLQEVSTPTDRKLRFPKWYFRSPNNQESFLFSQYIVRVPKGVEFAFATRNLGESVDFQMIEDDNGTRNFIWTGKNMPEAIHEEGSPAISSTLPYVAIASRQSWNAVHNSMILAYLGKTIPTLAIKDKVAELLADTDSETAKISKIYDYVNREIISSGSRAPASHIFLQKSGNKRNLLLAMLHAAGIKADLAAVRPPKNIVYDPVWKLPSDNNFTDYLIRAKGDKGEDIWLDSRARYSRAGEIGEDFCNGTAFILGLNKCEFVTIPHATEDRYTIERTREYTFDANKALIHGQISYPGTRGWEFKENFVDLNSELRLGVLEDILSKSLFGITVTDFTTPGLTTPGTDFRVDYSANINNFLRENTGGEYGIYYALPAIKLLPERNANNRKTPYHLSNFVAGHDRYTYTLPNRAVIKNLPADIIIRSKFGHYSLCFTQDNNRIILERKYNFQPQIISLNDWNDYYNLSRQIDQIENSYLSFTRKN